MADGDFEPGRGRVRRFGADAQVAVAPAERDMLQRLLSAGAIEDRLAAAETHPALKGANPAALVTLMRTGLAERVRVAGLSLSTHWRLTADGLEVAALLASERGS